MAESVALELNLAGIIWVGLTWALVYTIFEILVENMKITKLNKLFYYGMVPIAIITGIFFFLVYIFNNIYTSANLNINNEYYLILIIPTLIMSYFPVKQHFKNIKSSIELTNFREQYPLRKVKGE